MAFVQHIQILYIAKIDIVSAFLDNMVDGWKFRHSLNFTVSLEYASLLGPMETWLLL